MNPFRAEKLLPAVLLVATTAIGFAICVLALMAGWLTIFQNVLYIPIIIACVYYMRRGFAVSVGIALGYFALMLQFSQDPAVLQGALIRVAIFVLVAAVVTYLAEVRARAERDLREANEYLTNLIAYANAPIVVWDKDYRITRFNRAFSHLTGIPPEEAIGSHIGILFPEATRESSMEIVRRATAGEAMDVAEIPILHRSGEVKTVLWNSANIHGPDGLSVIATIAQGQDITERKKAEEALQMANKKLNLLSSITRHDINNQLTIIQGYAALLAEERLDPAIQAKVGTIAGAAERIAAIIRFTKEYESIGVHAPAWQDFRKLVDASAREVSLGDVRVVNDIPAGLEVFADPLIHRVIFNLVDNAVRYGGKVTTIRFSAEEAGDGCTIVCEDDGHGIPAGEKEKIFGRGYGKNTGMGLFLSREILAITGISIRETGRPGEGARFELLVPRGKYRVAST